MKKYLFLAALLSSSSSFAFPAYNIVSCNGNINGHKAYFEFNKSSHILSVNLDGDIGATYANESANRIYTNAEYDEDGTLLMVEITSNSSNWNAKFNLYANNQLVISAPLSCKKLGLKLDAQQSSVTSLISKLNAQ